MRTSIIALIAAGAASVIAQEGQHLFTREEIGDALVTLYIREASAAGHDVEVASKVLPMIKHDPVLLRRYAEADPRFKQFFKKLGGRLKKGLKKVGKFALKGAGYIAPMFGMENVVGLAQQAAGVSRRDLDWDEVYENLLGARDFDDQLEIRDLEDYELFVRGFDDQLETRDFQEDQLEAREDDDEVMAIMARNAEWADEFNQQLKAREEEEVAGIVARNAEWAEGFNSGLQARSNDDQLEVREENDEVMKIIARNAEWADMYNQLHARSTEDELEVREIEDEINPIAARDAESVDMYNDQFEARDVEDLYVREFLEELLW